MKESNTIFGLNNFSRWCIARYCIFTGWGADKSQSTLPKMEKAAFTVVHSKIPNVV